MLKFCQECIILKKLTKEEEEEMLIAELRKAGDKGLSRAEIRDKSPSLLEAAERLKQNIRIHWDWEKTPNDKRELPICREVIENKVA